MVSIINTKSVPPFADIVTLIDFTVAVVFSKSAGNTAYCHRSSRHDQHEKIYRQ